MDKKPKVKPRYLIGIDPGIVCGFALYDVEQKVFNGVSSFKLHELFAAIRLHCDYSFMVYIENPNTWVPFRNVSKEVIEMKRGGAMAVKQTYKHIIEFLEDNAIPYHPTRLQGGMKKLSSAKFRQYTGWTGLTNEHGRDAAMLVYGK